MELKKVHVSRSDALHVRAVREKDREADFIASTDTIDRHGEIVDQGSWQLDAFKRNPVILYGHQSFELPIGQATRCDVVGGQLECTIRFASAEANPQAEQVWQLVKEKVLRAVSVGFYPTDARYEMRDGEEVFVFYGNELREISVVALPANPDALAKMKSTARDTAVTATHDQPTKKEETTMGLTNSEADLQIRTLNTDLKTMTERATTAEAKLAELEVDRLIGVKIAPSEREEYLALYKSNPSLFAKLTAGRPEMRLTERITTTDAKDSHAQAGDLGDTGADLYRSL